VSGDERIGSGARAQLAAELAVHGGRVALEYFHRARRDDASNDTAEADIRERLAAKIAAAFPDDAVVGAEPGQPGGRSHGLYSWVVAPVEATRSFGLGLPGFAVSIGVLRSGLPFVGAVYDPLARWLFTACAGRGAWLNERPLHAQPAPLTRASVVAIGSPFAAGLPPVTEDWLRRYRLRGFGSTALHLCYVAMGALDLVHDHRARLEDIAGAATVVLEAGGVLTRADGAPVFPAPRPHLAGAPLAVLAGNRTSHAEALAEVAPLAPA
jgi:myo-inositol-1(or 4)-monophosphatase